MTKVATQNEAVPWLEFYPPDQSTPRITKLDDLPLTVGRSETCDLILDSQKISREHAVLYREGSAYIVKDLQSTNGTTVNGSQIEKSRLSHGDQVQFADVPFSFCHGSGDTASRIATQVMQDGEGDTSLDRQETAQNIIRSVRRAHEQVTRSGVYVALDPIVRLKTMQPIGFDVRPLESATGPSVPNESRPAARLRRLHRLAAAERLVEWCEAADLFTNLDPSETNLSSIESFHYIRSVLGTENRLVVVLPESTVTDTSQFRDFIQAVRGNDFGVGYRGFGGGEAQIDLFRQFPPDFIKLDLARIVDHAESEDCVVELQTAIRTIHDMQCEIITTGIQSDEQVGLSRAFGCRLAQGELFRSHSHNTDVALTGVGTG